MTISLFGFVRPGWLSRLLSAFLAVAVLLLLIERGEWKRAVAFWAHDVGKRVATNTTNDVDKGSEFRDVVAMEDHWPYFVFGRHIADSPFFVGHQAFREGYESAHGEKLHADECGRNE